MQLEKRTNLYGHDQLKCPFCEEWHALQSIKTHIGLKASWEKRKGNKNGKHLKFWMENTKEIKTRVWKDFVITHKEL